MLVAGSRWILDRATGRNAFLAFLMVLAWMAVFQVVLVPGFEAASGGLRPIDLSFPTTPELIYTDVPRYTPEARRWYAWFAAVDFVYPPTMATFFAFLWAWLADRAGARRLQGWFAAGLLLLPFAAALCDWAENLGFLGVIFAYPRELPGVAAWACSFKQAKLVLNVGNVMLSLVLAVWALVAAVRRRAAW